MKFSFTPLQAALELLEDIAKDGASPYHKRAVDALAGLEDATATEAEADAVREEWRSHDEVDVDDNTLFAARGDEGGVWVSAWVWMPGASS
ncbi:hypothetical protein [Gluconobacter sp. Gdi]|uniref:hypothetical protein n=1 Tax=Gluconobacter sp. Gdi TaxID=2691888 RepID=UPI001768C973|nr:hypothetical protein [Gluconobacter sp. Gdi]GFE98090.1 hypothetical protein DmGdi_31630 [Gluconobacter sp. Gdi]